QAHVGQRQGEALAAHDQVGGGVGVEVGGATLGLAAHQLAGIFVRLPVVGDQSQVDGQVLPAAPQPPGQASGQGAVEAAFEDVQLGQVGKQGLAHGLVGGGPGQAAGGGEQGAEPAAGGEDHGQQGPDRATAAVVVQAEFVGEQLLGLVLDVGAGEGKLHETQASGGERRWVVTSFSEGGLRSSSTSQLPRS